MKKQSKPPVNRSMLTPLQLHRKVGLMRAGLTGADIARQTGRTKAAVSAVMLDKLDSEVIEDAIAEALGEPVEHLFPRRALRKPAA